MGKPFFYPWMPPQPISQTGGDPAGKLLETLVTALVKEQKKAARKLDAKKDEKKEEKKEEKKNHFTYWQTAALFLIFGIPAGAIELFILKGFGTAFMKAVQLN